MNQKTIRKIENIKKFLVQINAETPESIFYQNVTTNIKRIFEADGSAFYIYDNNKNELKLVCVNSLREELVGITVKANQGLLGEVVKHRKAMKIDDYKNWPGRSEIFEKDQYSALLEAPLISGSSFLGIIGLVRIGESKAFTELDMSLLSLLAMQIAIILDLKQ
jgi:signal transduction protein with GAF and PtsI domain